MSTTPRPTEAPLCRQAEVVVVGGGNSGGQAAVFLAGIASKVYLVIRGDDLYKSMSAYLARRIEQTPNIEVLLDKEVRQMHGDDGDRHLRSVEIVDRKTGERRTLETRRCSASSEQCREPNGSRPRSTEMPRRSSGPEQA